MTEYNFPQKLIEFYNTIDYEIVEGSIDQKEASFILNFLEKHPEVKRIVETGFNGGISASCFLSARPDIQVLSFDIGDHDYIIPAKRHIDHYFPGRHNLIIGNSMTSVPTLQSTLEFGQVFDLVFIDGGHFAPLPASDLANLSQYIPANRWILMDDYTHTHTQAKDIIQAWDQAQGAGLIETVETDTGSGYRGWVLGRKK